MTVISEFEGLDDAGDYFKRVPDRSKKAARLAINRTVSREGMKLVQDEMYDDVNFPKGYLKGDRLFVSRYATESNLEGVILGRKRATSLARFASAGTPIGSGYGGGKSTGVTVQVNRGKTTRIANAWLVRLKRGTSKTEDQFNIGLAVRLKPGEKLNKTTAHRAWLVPNVVALLYGPSVDQVFKDVAEETGPQMLTLVAKEFFRQFDRLGS